MVFFGILLQKSRTHTRELIANFNALNFRLFNLAKSINFSPGSKKLCVVPSDATYTDFPRLIQIFESFFIQISVYTDYRFLTIVIIFKISVIPLMIFLKC